MNLKYQFLKPDQPSNSENTVMSGIYRTQLGKNAIYPSSGKRHSWKVSWQPQKSNEPIQNWKMF